MEQTRWLSQREMVAWRDLQLMQMHITSGLGRELARSSSLSTQDYEVLVVVTEQPKGMRLFELGRFLGWEKSRLSHHVIRMVERGLIKKVQCDDDRRSAVVTATRQGIRELEKAAPGYVTAVRRLFLDFVAADDLDLIGEVAQTVLAGINQQDQLR